MSSSLLLAANSFRFWKPLFAFVKESNLFAVSPTLHTKKNNLTEIFWLPPQNLKAFLDKLDKGMCWMLG